MLKQVLHSYVKICSENSDSSSDRAGTDLIEARQVFWMK